jgi:hypothetical protein
MNALSLKVMNQVQDDSQSSDFHLLWCIKYMIVSYISVYYFDVKDTTNFNNKKFTLTDK